MPQIRVQLFGEFRNHHTQDRIEIEIQDGCKVADLRTALQNVLGPTSLDLLASSVFADAEQILNEQSVLQPFSEIAVLPPVCGG